MKELSYVYPIICFLCSCSLLFFTAAHFHLAGYSLQAASISHRRFEFPCSSPLFSITRSSSFSVIRVSVNIKHNAKKETTLFCCFSKSPGGHVISFQIKPWVAFGLPYLLIELFYIGMTVVRTNGRSLDCSVYGHATTKFPWMSRLPHFLSYGPLPKCGAKRHAWTSAKKSIKGRTRFQRVRDCKILSEHRAEFITWKK